MSKRISLFLPAFLVATLGVFYLFGDNSAGAISPQRPRAPKREVAASAVRHSAIIATTAAILKETSEIRELPILRPVKSGAESRADIERMLIRNLDSQRTPSEMRASELTLRKFGLVPDTFEYRPFIIKLLTEQVAGYYDPKAQEFHIADWLDLEGQKPVMSHELVHALQDQHFNLKRFEKWPRGDSDAQLAAHALVEGDAMLAMAFYMVKNPMVALALTRSLGAGGISTEQYDKAPRAIKESLIFPYLNGFEFVKQVHQRGGWKAVSKAYTNLPLSTEQILHVDKYLSYERPVKLTLPDLSKLLNEGISTQHSALSPRGGGTAGVPPAPRALPPHRRPNASRKLSVPERPMPVDFWRRLDSDVSGEWSYYLLLDQFLKSPTESKRAAAGWGGDRYDIYEGPGGQVLVSQLTAWDTENDAREFFDAYVKRTDLRYPNAKRLDSSALKLETQNPQSRAPGVYYVDTAEGRVVVEMRGSRVMILEGIPDGIRPEVLLKSL